MVTDKHFLIFKFYYNVSYIECSLVNWPKIRLAAQACIKKNQGQDRSSIFEFRVKNIAWTSSVFARFLSAVCGKFIATK